MAKKIRRLEELELENRVTFMRVDFNVPIEGGVIGDDTRVRASLPSIELCRKKGARLVLASHLGRPKGKDPSQSLEPVGAHLAGLLGTPVVFADDCVGDGVRKNLRDLRPGEVLLLENLRFHSGEEKNEEAFARALADGVDVYVNDAFGTAHRAHASTAGMVRFVREKGAGLLMLKELDALGGMLTDPERPFVAVLGGAKVSDKLAVLDNLVKKANTILVGGAMAYTFLAAKNIPTGDSKVEQDRISSAELVIKAAAAKGCDLVLPVDHVAAAELSENASAEDVTELRGGLRGLDIGPKTRMLYAHKLEGAKTIFWNGPMGVFEWDRFAAGTMTVAKAIASSRGRSVVGGGDSAAAVEKAGVTDRITHVSTGGGASLEFMEGRVLPGVAALEE
ncbi:MAG: phosphoglycerate kinase [Deltaproteobacteria bacterium]|nr:phosphoglycerate kinase [Deltaproteobacteria bacterium]